MPLPEIYSIETTLDRKLAFPFEIPKLFQIQFALQPRIGAPFSIPQLKSLQFELSPHPASVESGITTFAPPGRTRFVFSLTTHGNNFLTVKMVASELLALPSVSGHPTFSDENNWRYLCVMYNHVDTDDRIKFICRKGDPDWYGTVWFPNTLPTGRYEKIVIMKEDLPGTEELTLLPSEFFYWETVIIEA